VNRLRMRLAGAVAWAGVSLYALTGTAHAGEYEVAQCHAANASHEASTVGANRGDYAIRDECAVAPDRALKVLPNTGAPSGHVGYWYWEAPPGTKIVAVDVEAKLRRSDGNKARLYMANGVGQTTTLVATGQDGPAEFARERWAAPAGSGGAARFYAALVCENDGQPCGAPSEAKTFVRNVELTLRDTVAPTVSIKPMETPWTRGFFTMTLGAQDSGGGIDSRDILVNGVGSVPRLAYPCRRVQGTSFVSALTPCLGQRGESRSLNSSSYPFHDGTNRLAVCARDLSILTAANVTCAQTLIAVDNTAPDLSFRNEQDVSDPELIRAPAFDVTSGLLEGSGTIEFRRAGSLDWEVLATSLKDGQFQARVDSESRPEGVYEFRVSARDIAGNASSTVLRTDGSPMRLHFPLKQEVDLDAFFPGGQTQQLAPYKQPSKVRGFLRREDGSPIADEQVVIEEVFDDGSLVQHRTDRVRTNSDGAFTSSIPGGPSRNVTVTYAGSRRYMDDAAPDLDYNVKSRVSLEVESRVRAGKAVRFKGRVGRYYARVPAGGKLVELQFKKRAKTWNTAKEALGTTSRGRVQIPYRFRRYYTEPVTFVFRLKVTRETAWPYKLPASSKPVQVTVLPRPR